MHVVFVCTGNICRSPMAERVARAEAAEAGLTGVEFTSAGTSSEEAGNPIDPRAQQILRANGYDADGHTAHRVTKADLTADLLIAAEPHHAARLRSLAPDADIQLLSDFDPDAAPGTGMPDPWYGPMSGFRDTLDATERAMPGLLDEIRRRTGQ